MKKSILPAMLSAVLLMTGCSGGIPGAPGIEETVAELFEAVKEDVDTITGLVTGGPEGLIDTLISGKDEKSEEESAEGQEAEQNPKEETSEMAKEETFATGIGSPPGISGEETQESQPEETKSAKREDPNYVMLPKHYRNRNELKYISEFTLDGENKALRYNGTMMNLPGTKENTAWLVGPDGKKALDYELDSARCKYLGEGFYIVAKDVSEESKRSDNGDIDRNSLGLVRIEGTEVRQILPCEYAGFEFVKGDFMLDSSVFSRFIKVFTVEEPTDDRSDYLLFFTDRSVGIIPQEGDFIYNGHWDLYDLAGEAFVPGISSEKRSDSKIKIIGNGIVLRKDDDNILYDAYGKEVLSLGSYFRNGIGYVIVHKDGFYIVYDDLGNEMFRKSDLSGEVESVGLSESGFLRYKNKDTGENQILDRNGTLIFTEDVSWGDFVSENDGVFLYNGRSTAVSSSGEILKEAPEGQNWLHSRGCGYYTTVARSLTDTTDRATRSVLSREGLVGDNLEGKDTLTFNFKDDAGNHYVFDKKEYSIPAGTQERMLDTGLLLHMDDSGSWGLYDLFSGEKLLDHKYGLIAQTGHMIIAVEQPGIVTVYELLGPDLMKEEEY